MNNLACFYKSKYGALYIKYCCSTVIGALYITISIAAPRSSLYYIMIAAPRKLVLSTLFIAAPRIYWVDLDISTSLVHFLAVFALFSGISVNFGV